MIKRDGLAPLFLNSLLRQMSIDSLSIFTAVYLFQLGKENGNSLVSGINWVVYFAVCLHIAKLTSMFLAEELSKRKGYKSAIRLSYLPFLVSFMLLMIYSKSFVALMLAASFWGLHAGFYWWGYHGIFIKKGVDGEFGREIGQITFLSIAASVASPFVFGFIMQSLGYPAMVFLALIFMMLSFVVIGGDYDEKQKHDVTARGVLKLLSSRKTIVAAYMGFAMQFDLLGRFWPIFLYISLGTVLNLGIFYSLVALVAAGLALYVGKLTDKFGGRRLVYLGSPLIFVSWLLKILFSRLLVFGLADSIYKMSENFVAIPLIESSYIKGKAHGSANAIMFREVAINLGIILMLFTMFVVNNYWDYRYLLFGGGMLGSLIVLPSAYVGKFDFYKKDGEKS